MLANSIGPSVFEQDAMWLIFKLYVSLLYGWFLLNVPIQTAALSAPCSRPCPRANVPPGQTRQETSPSEANLHASKFCPHFLNQTGDGFGYDFLSLKTLLSWPHAPHFA